MPHCVVPRREAADTPPGSVPDGFASLRGHFENRRALAAPQEVPMLPAFLSPRLRAAACATALLFCLAPAQIARAQNKMLHLRIDGVSGAGSVPSPLGADAFPVLGFTIPVGKQAAADGALAGSAPPPLEDVSFTMAVTSPAVLLWQLAVQGKAVPKASLAALDAEGKIRYRIDLEQVVVRSFGLQTFGTTRETVVGTLGYERIRLTRGEGKDAVSASWDRTRNAPWK
jgi:type VI protein secretion system component Hcp